MILLKIIFWWFFVTLFVFDIWCGYALHSEKDEREPPRKKRDAVLEE